MVSVESRTIADWDCSGDMLHPFECHIKSAIPENMLMFGDHVPHIQALIDRHRRCLVTVAHSGSTDIPS